MAGMYGPAPEDPTFLNYMNKVAYIVVKSRWPDNRTLCYRQPFQYPFQSVINHLKLSQTQTHAIRQKHIFHRNQTTSPTIPQNKTEKNLFLWLSSPYCLGTSVYSITAHRCKMLPPAWCGKPAVETSHPFHVR